jgi:hypothetical protein
MVINTIALNKTIDRVQNRVYIAKKIHLRR